MDINNIDKPKAQLDDKRQNTLKSLYHAENVMWKYVSYNLSYYASNIKSLDCIFAVS